MGGILVVVDEVNESIVDEKCTDWEVEFVDVSNGI